MNTDCSTTALSYGQIPTFINIIFSKMTELDVRIAQSIWRTDLNEDQI